ncbi:hypothetical protein [Arenibaculum sp.]|jgi:hypothetical protein|uniref:hypothetical protein n=1 Tax=Arenibaculum sp. TaxID=2865862 RepID=UPI002E13D890|nr:hypothetical protein [Arenibaculum sp.]
MPGSGKRVDRPGDEATRAAVAVLAAAFAEIKMPGVVGLRVITSALREAARSGSADALEFAGRSFDTIDPETRKLIARHVEDYARRNAPRGRAGMPQTSGVPTRPVQRRSHGGATGLLSVINR